MKWSVMASSSGCREPEMSGMVKEVCPLAGQPVNERRICSMWLGLGN